MRKITNFRLPRSLKRNEDDQLCSLVLNDEGVVLSISPMSSSYDSSWEDWKGHWLSPMAIDLQMNGGLGLSFPELQPQDLPKLLELLDKLWMDGVEAICPTLISCSVLNLRKALYVLQEARSQKQVKRCQLLGAHLEGPFLSKEFRGAHALEDLCPPSLLNLQERIKGFETEIALVTLAPELFGSKEVIKRLNSLGIVMSLGHSAATSKEASLAFDQGVSMITHTFNAMNGFHHRESGPIGEAILRGNIAMGLIADGVHVEPTVAVLLQRLALDQLVLVSDALSAYGVGDGQYQWGERMIWVEKGTCRLLDGTLAGVSIPLLEGCTRLASWSQEPSAAIWAATISPRRVLGKTQNIESYIIGKSLKSLLRWHISNDTGELSWQRAA